MTDAFAGKLHHPYQYVRLCAWGGPVLLLGTSIFWAVLGQNLPPYSPALSAQAFAAQILAHAAQIRIGIRM